MILFINAPNETLPFNLFLLLDFISSLYLKYDDHYNYMFKISSDSVERL